MTIIDKLKLRKFFTSRKSRKISPTTVSKSQATVSKPSEKRLWKEFRKEDHILNEHVRSSLISSTTVSKSLATVSKPSEKRLWKEFREEDHFLINEHVRFSLAPPENIFRWEATIIAPASCPFENGAFLVSVHIPTKYPYKPPKITFKTKIFHPNIDERGKISVDILGSNWSPALRVHLLLLSICSILSDPVEPFYTSNPAATLYRKDRKAYERTAREWTVKYAKG